MLDAPQDFFTGSERPPLPVKRGALILGLSGLALFCGIFVWRGVGEVTRLLSVAGFGLIGVALWHVVPLAFDVLAWRSVIRTDDGGPAPPRLRTVYWIRWVGESINSLLPVLSIGGELAKIRLLMQRGVGGARASASLVVDMTLALMAEIVFVLAGIGALLIHSGEANLPAGLGFGLTAAFTVFLIVYAVQRRGPFTTLGHLLARLGLGEGWLTRFGGIAALDAAIADLHSRHLAILGCFISRFAAWVLGTGEIYLALRLLGSPVSLTEAFIMESLCQATRTAGFMVPGAIGIQEGGYVVAGRLIGLDEDVSLALSMTRRIRDVALGIPGLVVWQIVEGRRALRADPE